MQTRNLGALEVSALGLGLGRMSMSFGYGPRPGGADRPHRLQENVGAAAVELDVDDLREIDSTTSRMQMVGARYSEGSQRMIDR